MTNEPTPDAPGLRDLIIRLASAKDKFPAGSDHRKAVWQAIELLRNRPLPSDWVAVDCEKCGGPAVHYLVMDNLPPHRRMPFCDRCTFEHEQTAQEVNDHEMRHFGGSYGLVTYHYEPLEAVKPSPGEDQTHPRTGRREGAVKTLLAAGWKWDGKQWAAPSAPAEGGELAMAQRLAVSLWQQHYSEDAPNWKVDDTLTGVLLQISNMTSGMRTAPEPLAQGAAEHERDALAEAIGKAAIKCGLLRPDIEGLTGPQLLMVVDDMASALLASTSPQPAAEESRASAAYHQGWRDCAMNNGYQAPNPPQPSASVGDDEPEPEDWRIGWALAYAGWALYTDDGELQDNRESPFIDFRRDDAALIRKKIAQRAIAKGRIIESATHESALTTAAGGGGEVGNG